MSDRLNIGFIENVWIPDLRSGKFAQAKGFLRVFDEVDGEFLYCCLGRACDLAQLHVNGTWGGITKTIFKIKSDSILDESDNKELSYSMRQFLGVDRSSVSFSDLGITHKEAQQVIGKREPSGEFLDTLIALNDAGADFYTIADILQFAVDKEKARRLTSDPRETHNFQEDIVWSTS